MFKRLSLIAMLVIGLSACAPARYSYYGDSGYRSSGSASVSGYYGGGAGSVYYSSGYPDWYLYPAYYSMFWSLNRRYVDPFYHPHFYYGVTWFPRNYYNVAYRHFPRYRDYWWPGYGHLYYSPYRLAWVDSYYAWYPWYSHHPHLSNRYYDRYYAPRYGSARNEAERLARFSSTPRYGWNDYGDRGRSPRRWDDRTGQREAVIDRREAVRGADYGSRTRGRIDPDVSGFNAPTTRGQDRRGAEYGRDRGGRDTRDELQRGDRIDPRVSGFQAPRGSLSPSQPSPARAPSDSRDQLRRYGNERREAEAGIPYPYRSGTPSPTRDAGVTTYREARPATREARTDRFVAPREPSYQRAPTPSYSAPVETPRYQAPPREPSRYAAPRETPSYNAPSRGGWSAPEPSRSREASQFERREAPREPARYSAPERSERSSSRDDGDARGELRRSRGDESER